ncbi:MAG TPA: 2,3-bisphosphoglycerate-independent phosphoglycerate mutase [bacterium]|nr:2,3-bisphosphoglycerate-independent phosphoglycerate mutase [bacterium]HPV65824.1 2,3-bisphosphoglycerate-independent phosphoglycerate mutase [bacterium]
MMKKPIVLIIMDGYGINKNKIGNAIALARKPNLNTYFKKFPNTTLSASGESVGLLKGQMGNSEVGHLNIGAGRIVYQNSLRISNSIKDGSFFINKEFLELIKYCQTNKKPLHLFGLISDGGVHSLNHHLYSLLLLARKNKIKNVYIHCVLDGRDAPPRSALKYLRDLNKKIKEIGVGKIATVMGRYYAMDRDSVWSRTKKAYDSMVLSRGNKAKSFEEAIKLSYQKNVSDEFFEPTIILEKNKPVASIERGDGLIFFNFRGDRARQICRALTFNNKNFGGFKREKTVFPLKMVSLTEYDKKFKMIKVAYKPVKMNNVFGDFISKKGFKQLRIAETTKYAHVTFFFNGGIEKPYKNEDRILVPSPLVDTFDLKPEMSAVGITSKVIKEIKKEKYDFIIMNYANGDMVGHSANLRPTIKAIETVDKCVGEVVSEVLKKKGIVFITADHGNAEQLIDYKTKKPMTAHTTNLVPFIIVGLDKNIKLKKGILGDIIPTILDVASIKKPKSMTGDSLIIKK